MRIHVLPESVAAQIAAGEVVERPASVVKELLENALDAGAQSIAIEVRQGGRRLIRVSDDGSGIPTDEVQVAFHRHSTNKITSASDLDAIQTLGFRGEALASIASVSQVTMVTRFAGEMAGTRVRIEGSHIVSSETVGAALGTVIAVENLFFNVPARLKFLRTKGTEKRHISSLVTRYAMAYPAVRFRLTHDGRLVFRSAGGSQLKEVLIDVYGLETARQMMEVGDSKTGDASRGTEHPAADVRVSGYTSAPALSRANRSHITLFVNGRWVQDQGLTFAVIQAYQTILMKGRYPVALIMVAVPPADVDVHVHPTKAEVRFREKRDVFSAVQRAVRRALVDSDDGRATRGESAAPGARSALASLQPVARFQAEMELPGAAAGQRLEPSQGSTESLQTIASEKAKLPLLRVVGQVGAAYIVAEGPGEIFLIDQHAAHERILYEQLMAQREEGLPTQTLLETAAVEVPPHEAALLEEHIGVLRRLGFMIEHFGGTTFTVRGMPALLGDVDPAAAIQGIADDLERGVGPMQKTIEKQIIMRVCQTAAVKAGQVLTQQELSAIVRRLEGSESPHTCPHGRPTMLHLSAEQLARQFGRR